MTPVYQTIVDPDHGNCMQATFASLFDMNLEDVPHFLELKDGWFPSFYKIIVEKGYDYEGGLYNKKLNELRFPGEPTTEKFQLENIKDLQGVNGYFYACVYSPKYFDPAKGYTDQITHAVIVDKNLNIVHDPNPNNKDVKYPLADEIGHNGIHYIFVIEPKEPGKDPKFKNV